MPNTTNLTVPIALYSLNNSEVPSDLIQRMTAIWKQANIQLERGGGGSLNDSIWPTFHLNNSILDSAMRRLVRPIWAKASKDQPGAFAVCVVIAPWNLNPNGRSYLSPNRLETVCFIRDHTEHGIPLGRVASHEFGHALLGGDEAHVSDPKNLMSEGQQGTALTEEQKAQARSWAEKLLLTHN